MALSPSGTGFPIGSASDFSAGTFPDAAVLTDGTLAVTFSQTTLFPTAEVPDADGAVFVALMNPDGSSKGPLIQANVIEPGGQGLSQVVALADGGFAVSWVTNAPLGSGHNDTDIILRLFNADGSPRTGEVEVTVDAPTPGSTDDDNMTHTLTALANGGVYVAWSDGGPVEGIFGQAFGAQGQKVGAEDQLAGANAHLSDSVQLNSGEILHGFLGGAYRLGTKDVVVGGPEARFTKVAALSNGGFVVAYEDFNSTSESFFHIHVFDAAGTEVTEIVFASEGTQVAPVIYDYDLLGLSGGGFVFAYPEADSDGRGIKAITYRNDGTQDGAAVSIPVSETSDQTSQTIAEMANGDLFAAYIDGGQAAVGYFLQGTTLDISGVGGGGTSSVIRGTSGKDKLTGTGGDDVIKALAGNDIVNAKAGKDVVDGGAGRDKLSGGGGNDKLNGGKGNDTLIGGKGKDVLKGGGGKDVLTGGQGKDKLIGGGGADTFEFKKGDGKDTITDFDLGVDVISIGKGANKMANLSFQKAGSDVIVSFANVEITVEDITRKALNDADNFLF
ncbi:MAG: calcium-binding protein [Marinibacterium sp.]